MSVERWLCVCCVGENEQSYSERALSVRLLTFLLSWKTRVFHFGDFAAQIQPFHAWIMTASHCWVIIWFKLVSNLLLVLEEVFNGHGLHIKDELLLPGLKSTWILSHGQQGSMGNQVYCSLQSEGLRKQFSWWVSASLPSYWLRFFDLFLFTFGFQTSQQQKSLAQCCKQDLTNQWLIWGCEGSTQSWCPDIPQPLFPALLGQHKDIPKPAEKHNLSSVSWHSAERRPCPKHLI